MPAAGVALLPPIIVSHGLVTDVFFHSSYSSSSFLSPSPTARPPPPPHARSTAASAAESVAQLQFQVVQELQLLSDKKRVATEQYLHLIESATDHFLTTRCGVDLSPETIPEQYLDVPPKDMGAIRRNYDILVHVSQDFFNTQSSLCVHLLEPIAATVYRDYIGPLRAEMERFWKKNERFVQPSSFSSSCSSSFSPLDDRTSRKVRDVKADLDHIDQMWQLDQMNAHQQAEMFKQSGVSHVVPVKGLCMNKIHRLLNEHQSVIEHFGSARRAAAAAAGTAADSLSEASPSRGGGDAFPSPPAAPARQMPPRGAPPRPPPPPPPPRPNK